MQHLTFNFIGFWSFWNSEKGEAMVFGNPWLLKFIIVVPYVLASEVYYFGTRRYFVKLGSQIAASFALRVEPDAIVVSSLAVSPEYRRKGIGLFILVTVEKLCRRTKVKRLELSVLKRNVSAQRLYWKFGFTTAVEKKWGLVLRKNVEKRKGLGSS